MTKRTPYNPAKKKQTSEQQKRLAAIKTAIPLLLTFALLGAVYLFVLLPEEPANILRRAVINSTDAEKYKSFRYDGSFGDTNRGGSGEFSGQKSANGNSEFRIRLTKDKDETAMESRHIGDKTYLKLSGTSNLKRITEGITGIRVPSDTVIATLAEVENKWVEIPGSARSLVVGSVACSDRLPGFSDSSIAPITEVNYPFEYLAGPISPNDDSEDQIYEVKLLPTANVTGTLLDTVNQLVTCLDDAYGKDDFRLRESGPADIASAKITMVVDPLSSTVEKFTYKQVGTYFTLNIRDYNKDVSVPVPDDTVTLSTLYGSLSESAKGYLGALGLPSF